MSYFVTCTHEQRILNGTSSDTSLCHWGTWKKKFSQTSQISQIWPDLARSGQIWDVWENFFFKKKKKFFQIWPDLGGPDLEIWPDLAASVFTTIHNFSHFSQFFTTFRQPSQFCSSFRVVKICENLSHFVKICEMHTPREAPGVEFYFLIFPLRPVSKLRSLRRALGLKSSKPTLRCQGGNGE